MGQQYGGFISADIVQRSGQIGCTLEHIIDSG
jgi:hypothetical protein